MAKSTVRQLATAWFIALVGLIGVAGLFVAGKGTLLRVAVPGAAFCVGLSLYCVKRSAYLEFALWTWFLTPFVRRFVDWRVGFADRNLVLLTPFLVSWIAILGFRNRERLAGLRISPFIFCGAGILYGFFVGMASHPSGEVIYGLVNWASPMMLGFHLYAHWRDFEENLAVIQRAALWGLLFMGAYGVFQFYHPPAWDTAWLENLPGGLESSTFGRPEPREIRVWSTSNAPGPFATVIVALLFFAMAKRSIFKLPALGFGLYSLMLSLVRTAWLTGVLGLLLFARRSNGRLFAKVVFAIGLGAIGVVALLNSSLDIPVLQERFKTLGDLKNDESVQDRTRLYEGLTGEVLAQPVGIGLNNSDFYHGYPLDSGPIRMLLNLGWFGTLSYALGVGQIVWLMYSQKNKQNAVLVASSSIVTALLLQMVSGLVFVSSGGAMFWLAAGNGLASIAFLAERPLPEANRVDTRIPTLRYGQSLRPRTAPDDINGLSPAEGN